MLNVVILIGRTTSEMELRHTPSNVSTCSFSLAVKRNYDKDKTDFINIVCWRNTAEFCEKYVKKGQLISVKGSIQTRSYEDKEGKKRIAFEIVADEVQFAEPKRDGKDIDVPPTTSNFEGDFQELANDEELPF
jgi:single-strand DNA-binding protein